MVLLVEAFSAQVDRMKKPTITLAEIEQEIDLEEFFPDLDFSEERAFKEAVAQAIIDKIVSRTEAGDGIKISANGQGRPVKLKSPYSDAYAKSLDFKAAGKSKGKVNMTLTGDMLASVDVTDTKGNRIKVGVSEDQVPKAFNHLTGDTVPERPWFGVSREEVEDILLEFGDDIQAIERKQKGEETIEDLANADDQEAKLRVIDFFDEDD